MLRQPLCYALPSAALPGESVPPSPLKPAVLSGWLVLSWCKLQLPVGSLQRKTCWFKSSCKWLMICTQDCISVLFFNNAEDFLAVANRKDTHVPHITSVSITEALPGTIYKSLYLCGCFATRSSSSIMIFFMIH